MNKFSPMGADGDHLDVYLGPYIRSPRVFIIDQLDADTGRFDEHKIFLGFASKLQALAIYRKAFSDGKADQRIGHVAEMTIGDFKQWLRSGDTTKPIREKIPA